MVEDNIKQIIINDCMIGIIGLDDAINKTAENCKGLTDNEIQKNLLEMISVNNYIPVTARDAYGLAALREFKIAQGISVEPETAQGLTIAVLGIGCTRCNQLASDIRDLLSEMKIAADLQHITDIKEISRYGVMGSPALVINKKVLSIGEVPPKSKIRRWIIDAHNQQDYLHK
jgi:hypothetical protein